LNGINAEIDPRIASMFQSSGVLQASAVTALETAPDDRLSISAAAELFSLSMPYARATVSLSREG
jgi:hypothetical protein